MRRLKNISDKQLEQAVRVTYEALSAAFKKAANPSAPTTNEMTIALKGSLLVGAASAVMSQKEQMLFVEAIARIEGIVKQELETVANSVEQQL